MSIDLSPLYRNTVGFDRVASLLDSALRSGQSVPSYPPYDIESTGENKYAITLAVAGFSQEELELEVNEGVLSVRGKKAESHEPRSFLHQGIANRAFERKFNLAEYIEVAGADLSNGLLTINLVKEIPEAMKPRTIEINQKSNVIDYGNGSGKNGEKVA